jgi:hypothetical protein
VNPNAFSELKVTRNQARRMLDNLVAHGELHGAIYEDPQRIGFRLDSKDQLSGYLAFFERMRTNYEGLARALMTRTGYQEQQFSVDSEKISAGQLIRATESARFKVFTMGRTDYAAVLQEELIRAKDERRARYGNPDQKKFARQLAQVRNPWGGFNNASRETRKHVENLKKLASTIRAEYPHASQGEIVSRVQDHLRSLSFQERIDLLTKADVVAQTFDANLLRNAMRRLADETALDLIDKYNLDYHQSKGLNAVRQRLKEIDDSCLMVIAEFFERNPWVPAYFNGLTRTEPDARPLSAIITALGKNADERLGSKLPMTLSDSQKEDFTRFVERSAGLNPWHDLYSFFGIPDEPEIPANRGDE